MRVRLFSIFAALIALAIIPSSALAMPKKAKVSFSSATYSVIENAGAKNIVLRRAGNTRIAGSVKLAVDPSSTAAAGDYSVTTGTINFAANETTKTIPVTIVDNTTAATNKTIVFKISNPSTNFQIQGSGTSTLTIIDDEGPGTLDFSSPTYTVLESGGFATITVNRIGASNLKVSADYAAASNALDANPATAVTDFTPVTGTVTLNPGEMSKSFQVPITNDSDAESPETVRLTLSNPQNLSGGGAPQIGPNSPASLTINDDDVSTFAFESTLNTVGEGNGQATITVARGGATNIAASVNYATSDGTATGGLAATTGVDYIAAAGTIDFAAGQTTKTFTVDIADDTTDEPNESVNLTLTSGATTVGTSTLEIVDNDNPNESVQFSDTQYSVGEGDGTATITVTLSHPLANDAHINVSTADGTAKVADGDYTALVNEPVTILAGQTSASVDVAITDDADIEDPETIQLTLSSPTGAHVELGAPSTATLTINDNDYAGNLEFNALSYNANETAGQATVTVRRVGGSVGAVSVDYATSDGSATGGDDYTATSGTLNFADGETTKDIVVPIAWDGVGNEPSETINLALSNPAGGSDLAPNTAAVIVIGDDGASGPVEFSATTYGTGESAGTVTITVTRSGGSLGGPVTVDYATTDNTAVAGSDYTAASGTLTFAPGEASKTFDVAILNDGTNEGAESFGLTLSNPGGGSALGMLDKATVDIADDDAAPAATGNNGSGSTGSTPDLQSTPANPNPSGSQVAATDKRAPKLTLSARKLQKAFKAKVLALAAKCDEACKLTIVVKTGKGKKAITFGKASVKAAAGQNTKVKVKLSKRALTKLARALKGGKAKVTISVVASDAAGNKTKGLRSVTVRR